MSRAITSSGVVCGLPGDVEHADDLKDHRNAKVGGQPVLPGQYPPETQSRDVTVCRNCGKNLVLVAQPCANDVSSWRAITCHLPGSITTDSKSKTPDCNTVSAIPDHITSTSTPGAQQEPAADEVDSWGAATDAWGASPADDSVGLQNQEAFDFSDLEDALSNTVNCVTTKQPKQRDRDISQHQQQHASSCCLAMDVARHSLPGFYLHMTAEAAGASASLSAEDQHIAELVAAYQDETKQANAPAAMEVAGDEWSGETYEEDKEGAFHEFCMLVQHVPQQCIRYSWGGTPLWPKKQKPSPGPCFHCGSRQVFEMQLLAPLMHYLEETCTWMLDDEQQCSTQIETAMQVLSSWQWLTVAVFSCSNGCQTLASDTNLRGGKSIWLEQTVLMACED